MAPEDVVNVPDAQYVVARGTALSLVDIPGMGRPVASAPVSVAELAERARTRTFEGRDQRQPAAPVRFRRRISCLPRPSPPGCRAARPAGRGLGPALSGRGPGLHHGQGRAGGHQRRGAGHLVPAQPGRPAGRAAALCGRSGGPPARRGLDTGQRGHGLRRRLRPGGPGLRHLRSGDRGPPQGGLPPGAGRHLCHRHRRPGHEMPQGPAGLHRGRDPQRSLFRRLRGLSGDLCPEPEPEHGRLRAGRALCPPSRGSGLALHGVHEFQGQAGPEGRRLHRRHRGRSLLCRHPQCPVQGAAPAHARRAGRTRAGAGRLLHERCPVARHGKPAATRGQPSRHRRAHGRVRRGPAGPAPLRRAGGAHAPEFRRAALAGDHDQIQCAAAAAATIACSRCTASPTGTASCPATAANAAAWARRRTMSRSCPISTPGRPGACSATGRWSRSRPSRPHGHPRVLNIYEHYPFWFTFSPGWATGWSFPGIGQGTVRPGPFVHAVPDGLLSRQAGSTAM